MDVQFLWLFCLLDTECVSIEERIGGSIATNDFFFSWEDWNKERPAGFSWRSRLHTQDFNKIVRWS